ncbi:MAG: TorD/DmsD family molecular chaperone [Pseudomonadota bacterium]
MLMRTRPPAAPTPLGPKERLERQAEFYLCLARAFLSPLEETAWRGMAECLADDLSEIARELGLDAGCEVSEYRAAMMAVPDGLALLQTYAALFLMPPAPAPLNTGLYLDGSLAGPSVTAMETCYRQCGVERDPQFGDLSDHPSVQLEFVALLYAREAQQLAGLGERPPFGGGQFLASFVRGWAPRFAATLERATRGRACPNPWLPLARLLAAAAERDAVSMPGAEAAPAKRPAPPPLDAEAVREMARKLRERGLATDHLPLAEATDSGCCPG